MAPGRRRRSNLTAGRCRQDLPVADTSGGWVKTFFWIDPSRLRETTALTSITRRAEAVPDLRPEREQRSRRSLGIGLGSRS
jgi:hypothetical protein